MENETKIQDIEKRLAALERVVSSHSRHNKLVALGGRLVTHSPLWDNPAEEPAEPVAQTDESSE